MNAGLKVDQVTTYVALKLETPCAEVVVRKFRAPRQRLASGSAETTADSSPARDPSRSAPAFPVDAPFERGKQRVQRSPPRVRMAELPHLQRWSRAERLAQAAVAVACRALADDIPKQLLDLSQPELIDALGKGGWSIEVQPWWRRGRNEKGEAVKVVDVQRKTITVFSPDPHDDVAPESLRQRLAYAIAEAVDDGALRSGGAHGFELPRRRSEERCFRQKTGTSTSSRLLQVGGVLVMAIPTFGLTLCSLPEITSSNPRKVFASAFAGLLLRQDESPSRMFAVKDSIEARECAEEVLGEILSVAPGRARSLPRQLG